MNGNIMISIIMPVYNAKHYINTTLQSIVNQTYKNFELIIIDDGATDGTGEICKKYSDKYTNIKYIKQKNAGTCAARNNGIELAEGDFIAFSDHDDEYVNTYLEKMVRIIEDNNVDVVKCGVYFEEIFADGTVKRRKEVMDWDILSQKELVCRYNALPISYFGVWNSLYRASILRENGIHFPVDIRHGQEDYYFNTDILPFIEKIGFSPECLYKHYRRIEQSTSARFYQDRIEAISLYFKRECEILKSLYDIDTWDREYGVLYARKITGVLSYVLHTVQNRGKEICYSVLNRYLKSTPYEKQISTKTWFMIFSKYPKYGLVLFLVVHKKLGLLIDIWKVKNR